MKKQKSSLDLGLTKYSISSNNLSKNDDDVRYGKYPNGLIPFILILLLWMTSVLLLIYVGNRTWQDGLSFGSLVSLLLNVLWFIGRQNIYDRGKYSLKKYADKAKLNRLKISEPFYDKDYAVHKVTNYDDFTLYQSEKRKRSSLFFCISFGLHSVLFITFLIVVLTVV